MQYQLVHEFEAWSKPGKLLPLEYPKVLLQHEIWNAGIPRDVFLGISAIPEDIDCMNLKSLFVAQEATEFEFLSFCTENGLPANVDSQMSAMRFLEFKGGRALAWIHVPSDAPTSLLENFRRLLDARGHIVVSPA